MELVSRDHWGVTISRPLIYKTSSKLSISLIMIEIDETYYYQLIISYSINAEVLVTF